VSPGGRNLPRQPDARPECADQAAAAQRGGDGAGLRRNRHSTTGRFTGSTATPTARATRSATFGCPGATSQLPGKGLASTRPSASTSPTVTGADGFRPRHLRASGEPSRLGRRVPFVLPDDKGRDRLVCSAAAIGEGMKTVARRLYVWKRRPSDVRQPVGDRGWGAALPDWAPLAA
jgi:hypothetical protein